MDSQALNWFLRDLSKIPTLTDEEERRLRRRIRAGDDSARQRLVEGSLSMALGLARRKARQVGYRHLQDLVCEANLTLVNLGRTFDPDHPRPFGVCAYFLVRQHLCRVVGGMLHPVSVPRAVLDLRRAERTARQELRQRLRREPTRDELAEDLRVPTARLEQAIRSYMMPLELDDSTTAPLPGAGPSPELLAIRTADASTVQQAILHLRPRQRRTLELRFGLDSGQPGTYAAIAAERGVSRQCVYQECRSALSRLCRVIAGQERTALNGAA
jgi:RNA polymerase primary sigma factor